MAEKKPGPTSLGLELELSKASIRSRNDQQNLSLLKKPERLRVGWDGPRCFTAYRLVALDRGKTKFDMNLFPNSYLPNMTGEIHFFKLSK